MGRGVEHERGLGGTADRRRVEEDQATGLPVRHQRARERERGDVGRMPVGGSGGQIAELLDLAAAQLRVVVASGPLGQAVAAERHTERRVDRGPAQVGVEEHDVVTDGRERHRESDGDGGLALRSRRAT